MSSSYRGIPGNASIAASKSIASSTNASPIAVTTSAAHNLATGDRVRIISHATNTAANGTWTITKTSATAFTLNGSTGNGVGGATGTVYPLAFSSAVLLPDDGDAATASSVNVPNEANLDRAAYLVERVGVWRVNDWQYIEATATNGPVVVLNGAYTAQDGVFDASVTAFLGDSGYVNVQPGDRVEFDLGPVLVTAGANPIDFALGFDATDYGGATAYGFGAGLVSARIAAGATSSVYLRGVLSIPASPARGTRIYPSLKGYGVGGVTNYTYTMSGGVFSVRVWRANS